MRSATGDATQPAGEHANKRDMRGCDEMRGGVRGERNMGERSERSAVVMLPRGLECVGEAFNGRGGGARKRHTQRGGGRR